MSFITSLRNGASSWVQNGAQRATSQATSSLVSKANEALAQVAGTVGALPDRFKSGLGGAAKDATNVQGQLRRAEMGPVSEIRAAAGPTASQGDAENENYKVRLRDIAGPVYALVTFEVMPQVTESRSVQYDQVQPPQLMGAFQKYKGTDPVRWTIQAKLISRNSQEAYNNLLNINLLRSWTAPFFGQNTVDKPSEFDLPIPEERSSQLAALIKSYLGAPPPVLELSGLRYRMIGPVPVVVTSLNWTWPPDVDYLPCGIDLGGGQVSFVTDPDSGQPIPFPSVIELTIECVESFSTSQINSFNFTAYAAGRYRLAYSDGQGQQAVSESPTAGRPAVSEPPSLPLPPLTPGE
jgi:hypothetical protein